MPTNKKSSSLRSLIKDINNIFLKDELILSSFIKILTDFESRVIIGLYMTNSLSKTSKILNVSKPRIIQALFNIRYNPIYIKLYGIKKTPNRGRKIRSNRRRNKVSHKMVKKA